MATVVLSAAGAAIGGSIGGSLAGLSSVAIGRAVGATLGKVIDQRLMGQGADAVETGRVDRFRLTNASEGQPIAQLYGRMRLGGQVIWASDFQESSRTTGGGKGTPSAPKTTEFSYSVNLAIAVCEGEITRIGRVWADGEEVSLRDLNARIYTGRLDQLPDPTLEAIEGAGNVPAYRGTAYVVLENLQLGQFGNRVPQFSFEVSRPERSSAAQSNAEPFLAVKGVALMPGTGEYALATTPVYFSEKAGSNQSTNVNSPSGKTDFVSSLEALSDELPNCSATSLVVSWFGNDLRCAHCSVKPKVERHAGEGTNMPWSVAGLTRSTAEATPQKDGRPIYGGTPTDASLIEAIKHLKENGKNVLFYPFILMDQTESNALADPWSDAAAQPALPWRGRITLSKAPGEPGSTDRTAAADAEVAAFFGSAQASDFQINGETVSYSGPQDWGFRRFILHYAAVCAAAGGVSSFCIGSEMRGLTQIRGANDAFAAVQQLVALAAEVRILLGAGTKIGYAADWSEYFGYMPTDGSNDRYFHLDPLWADANIDFVGIDNYMPLSDWRDGADHADVDWGSIYNPEYLKANIEGGDGYDWYYASATDEADQVRTPITDGAHDEAWVWRYKDLKNWWSNSHHERIAGVRQANATPWVPGSKPIWFTELGCAAVDKATNQPNKFVDAKSSESSLPKFSNGGRDDLIQIQYLHAMLGYWADGGNNPVSATYNGTMIDLENAYVWAWDARPYPFFPNNRGLWSDGDNYARGHWLNGRMSSRTLASVVSELCERSGVVDYDTSGLYGYVRGYLVDDVSDARAALQPLMLRYAFDAVERDGVLRFVMRDTRASKTIALETLVETTEIEGQIERAREAEQEMAGRVRLRFVQADADFETLAEEAVHPDEATHSVSTSEMPLSLTRGEGRQVVERWLTEARIARETTRFALPPSMMDIGVGDVVRLPHSENGAHELFRVDRVEQGQMQLIDAVRVEPDVYTSAPVVEDVVKSRVFHKALPILPIPMDLPLMTGDELPHAPHLAVCSTPWPGGAAVYVSRTDSGFALNSVIGVQSTVGQTASNLIKTTCGVWDHAQTLHVNMISGKLESVSELGVLNGANLAAIGSSETGVWEIIQFQTASLVGPDRYVLGGLLRGQFGTDGVSPPVLPQGNWFVLLDGSVEQIDLSSNLRGIDLSYRVGPSNRGHDDPSYTQFEAGYEGAGLRPYAPCHLSVDHQPNGDLILGWTRRTRIDGDGWNAPDVPLGEEGESYVLRILKAGTTLSEILTSEPNWIYSAPQRQSDGATGSVSIEVAQISARFGEGPTLKLDTAFP